MTSQIFKIDKVKRLIINPMKERGWTAPKNGNLEVIISDYVDVLGNYPEDVLKSAFSHMLTTHKYKSWPSLAEFDAAAKKFHGPSYNFDGNSADNSGLRTKKANEYASSQINSVFEQAWTEGWQNLARKWLIEQALYQLNQGADPHVPRETWPVETWKEEISHRSRKHA